MTAVFILVIETSTPRLVSELLKRSMMRRASQTNVRKRCIQRSLDTITPRANHLKRHPANETRKRVISSVHNCHETRARDTITMHCHEIRA